VATATSLSVQPVRKARAFTVVVPVKVRPPDGNTGELPVGSVPFVVWRMVALGVLTLAATFRVSLNVVPDAGLSVGVTTR
jgi:hypothetical protein